MSKRNKLNVTCAIIEDENLVLVVQRSENMKLPLKWEFPGGVTTFEWTEKVRLKT